MLTVKEEPPGELGIDPFNPANVAASAFPTILPFKPMVERQEPLKAEIRSFIDAVRRRLQPEVTLAAGRQALAVATQVVEAIAAHSEHAHLNDLRSAE